MMKVRGGYDVIVCMFHFIDTQEEVNNVTM